MPHFKRPPIPMITAANQRVDCARANATLDIEAAARHFVQTTCAQTKKACPHRCDCQRVKRNLKS